MIRKKTMRAERAKLLMNQQEMAEGLGCSRSSYAQIENGKRRGSLKFWLRFKNMTGISDAELLEVMQDYGKKDADISEKD